MLPLHSPTIKQHLILTLKFIFVVSDLESLSCRCWQTLTLDLRTALSRGLRTFTGTATRMNSLANGSCRNRTKISIKSDPAGQSTTRTPKTFYLVPASLTLLGCHSVGLFHRQAHCEYRPSRKSRRVEEVNGSTVKDAEFPWKEFLKLLLPDIWYLLGAVVVSVSGANKLYN